MFDPTSQVHTVRPARKPVGIAKGPGETTHEYTFVSRDDEQELKNGEYVYYELSGANAVGLNGSSPLTRRVLGRILKRIPPQSGKQIFLADDEMLSTILSRKRTAQPGSATIGSLLTREPDAVPIVL